jgi:hypothetical protein
MGDFFPPVNQFWLPSRGWPLLPVRLLCSDRVFEIEIRASQFGLRGCAMGRSAAWLSESVPDYALTMVRLAAWACVFQTPHPYAAAFTYACSDGESLAGTIWVESEICCP